MVANSLVSSHDLWSSLYQSIQAGSLNSLTFENRKTQDYETILRQLNLSEHF